MKKIILWTTILCMLFLTTLHAKTNLKPLIDEAFNLIDGIVEEDYSIYSWNQLEINYEKAVEVYENQEATCEQIEEAKHNLQNALDSLVDRNPLLNAAREVEEYIDKEELYTTDSFQRFKQAYDKVLEMYHSNESYTDKDIRFAGYDLTAAYEDLRLLSTTTPLIWSEVIDSKTIQLHWKIQPQADYYKIYRINTKTNKWIFVKKTTTNQATFTKLKTGKQYTYYVESIQNDKVIHQTHGVNVTPIFQENVQLNMKHVNQTTFQLQWNLIEGATRYVIYRKSNDEPMKKIISLKGNVTTYKSNNMVPNTYTYVIKPAKYDSTERVYGKASNRCTLAATYTKPQNFTLKRKNTTQIDFTWDKVDGVETYGLYKATKNSSTYTKVFETKENQIKDYFVRKGTNYSYKIIGERTYKGKTYYTPESDIIKEQ